MFEALSSKLSGVFDKLRSRGATLIDEKIAVQLGHLRRPDGKSPQARLVDELPGFVAGRVLERRSPGTALDRLG